MTIIRGTTPTIEYTFSEVNTADITVAYMTIKQYERTVVERDLTTATVEEGKVSWVLTQAETLLLKKGVEAQLHLDYLLSGGTRAAGVTETVQVDPTGKNEVISDE